jgi:hypothetical protein
MARAEATWRDAFMRRSPTEETVDLPARMKGLLDEATPVSGGEVSRVQSLFFHGLKPLGDLLNGLYGTRVSLNGVFCHGHPIVDFDHPDAPESPKGCELGDLLVVVNHVFDGGLQTGRSLLLQAKLPRGDVPARQELLYRDWPAFSYRRDPSESRSVRGGSHAGAQFAYLHDGGPVTLTIEPTERPQPGWEGELALTIVEMVQSHLRGGRELYPFSEIRRDGSGWSEVMWDLLRTMFSSETYAGDDRVLNRGLVRFFLDYSAFPELLRVGPDPQSARAMESGGRGPARPRTARCAAG